jgi:UDP-glucose:(heptosyl)LPS alpha-1,3-glucosyltransferase
VPVAQARLRVAIVRQRYNPYGGAERFIERTLPALERAGVEPTLITRRAEGWGARRLVAVDPPFFGSTWRDASFARAARRAWEAGGFDLIQSHERIPGCDIYRAGDGVHAEWLDIRRGATGPAGRALQRLRIALDPYHGYACAAERSLFAHPGLRAVICNSMMVRGEIARRFGVPPQKLHVIHSGVDLDHFHPRHRATLRAPARAQLGAGETDFLFLFVGSGFWRKGLDAAIGALARCTDENFRLVVAGRDRQAAGFARQARDAGLGAKVRFLGGREDVRPLYAAADCFILPTRYDPLPSAALEALAMGLPAIVGRRSGAAEAVRPGFGWICEPEDIGGLAHLMREAADAAGEASAADAARAASESYGIDDMTRKLTGLYDTLLQGRSGDDKP